MTLALAATLALTAGIARAAKPVEVPDNWAFRGVQEFVPLPKDVDDYCVHVTNVLGRIGVRQLVMRFAYLYEFKSHPECRQGDALSEVQVRRIRSACEAAGIEFIPMINLFGHQHQDGGRFGLLGAYPDCSETRGLTNECEHTRCICAKSDKARRIAVDLMAELAAVCGAKRVHIGCDEVMDLGVCDLCKGTPHDRLFADWVNGLSRGLKARGLGVMIWGDRLLDTRDYWRDDMEDFAYERGMSGTKDAVALLDRDITICDWQYYTKREYKSVERFARYGYKMILCPWNWRGTQPTETYFAFANKHDHGQIGGFLLTSWHEDPFARHAFEGRIPTGDDYNERGRTASCDYQRVLQLLFPKAAETLHDGWAWWNGAEDQLDPVEGKAYEPRKKVNRFYDRLPVAHSNAIPAAVWRLQKNTAGEVLRFRTGSDRLRIRWKPRFGDLALFHMPATGVSGLDVYQFEGGRWRYRRPTRPTVIRAEGNDYTWRIAPGLPTLVYLPLRNGVESIMLGVRVPHDIEPIGPHASGVTKPVVVYGTSTTQGGCVSRPGMCWTSIAGRVADVPVVNLGFSGCGKMEDVMGDCLAEADASLYVLDTVGDMDMPLLEERFEKFVRRLRAAKPSVPIAISLNVWPVGLAGEGAACHAESRFADRNAFLRGLFAKLKSEDATLWKDLHLTGDDPLAIAPDDEGTVDGTHLNDLGAQRFGTYMGGQFRKILGLRNQ